MSGLKIPRIAGNVLVVDDEYANILLLQRMLGHAGCASCRVTTDPRQAIDLAIEMQPHAVLLDLNMPHIDGLTLLRQFQERFPCRLTMPILVLTADATIETKHRALEAGASDFLTKPLDALELVLRLGKHLEIRRLHLKMLRMNEVLETRVRQRTADLEEAQKEIVERLSVATELRDDETGGHVERVANMAARLAEAMGLSTIEVDTIRQAARLHDVGKISVPDHLLLKEGPLDPDEVEIMREHTRQGGRILQGSRFLMLQRAEEIARHHHERWDGRGYPDGLLHDRIPIAARITAVADVYDALTHDRPYKAAWGHAEAIAEIARQSGTQFDPEVVQVFVRIASESADDSAPTVEYAKAA